MNELASVGLILLFALLAGHIVKFLRVPEVTGYIAAGVVVGPHVFGWITQENLQTLEVFSEVALGLILFSIGSVFEISRLRAAGATVATITITESVCAGLFVAVAMLAAGLPWPVAGLLAAIAVETAAATTLMVMRECNSAGPFTDTLTGVIAMNNILCIIAFSVVSAAIEFTVGTGGPPGWAMVYNAIYPLAWQLVGSTALGYLIGLLLAAWSRKVIEKGETLILLAGCVLTTVGVSHALELSPLVASLAVGATMVNLSRESRRLFEALGQTDPPLYAIFFVIAGADLNIKLLASLGVLGAVYVAARLAGKYAGAWVGSARAGVPDYVRRSLGFALFSQAGLAIGITITIAERFPTLAPIVNTIVLSAVVIFEIIGPLSTRLVLSRTGEVREQPTLVEPAF
jgi:Kef-type K+ transport system membrane component KefB